MLSEKQEVSVYIHIPFCSRKCPYCHFYVVPNNADHASKLFDALQKEWLLWQQQLEGKQIKSVYFGGGTPALFGSERVALLLEKISPSPDAEVTLEFNPEDVSLELMKSYQKVGVNRVSIGVQSFDNKQLKSLERTHSAVNAADAVLNAYRSGIGNITIDLMYDLPGQTLEQWQDSLDLAINLPITHISLYNLTIEPHTSFYKRRKELLSLQPKEDLSVAMMGAAQETLSAAGFVQYELSAFCRPGFSSYHNSGYWDGRSFIGLGPSAFSFWQGQRPHNVANINKYCEKVLQGCFAADSLDDISQDARVRELLAINFRLLEGVDISLFEKSQGEVPEATKKVLEDLKKEGFLELAAENKLRLTRKGILFYDTVAERIV